VLFIGVYLDPAYKSYKGLNCLSSPECWFQCGERFGQKVGQFWEKAGLMLGENEIGLGRVLGRFWEPFALEKVWV
jgi:hypothetical protein